MKKCDHFNLASSIFAHYKGGELHFVEDNIRVEIGNLNLVEGESNVYYNSADAQEVLIVQEAYNSIRTSPLVEALK
jgi:hypothetical protein